VRTGDVASRIHHHHQRGADGERRDRVFPEDIATDGEHEKKGADEFDEVFVHGMKTGGGEQKCAALATGAMKIADAGLADLPAAGRRRTCAKAAMTPPDPSV
jgi:hypothetical protein